MKKMFWFIISVSCMMCLNNCNSGNKYSYVENKEGQSVYLDNLKGKVIFINNSNRITDYVDLNLTDQEIQKIKNDKDKNDASQKLKDWGSQSISGTKYSVSFSTRFYKDKLLYIATISPYDEDLRYIASTISIDLVDISGFSLEKISPGNWVKNVDEKGKPTRLSYSGDIPMTLENYLEINNWGLMWKF
jgi:hypothetical protein